MGWSSLRDVLRSWGIEKREHLTEWLHKAGFPATLLGNHTSARAREYLFGEACRVDLIEVTCVRLAIHMGQEATGDVAPEAEQAAQQPTGTLWEQVDSFSLEDVFLRRVPMLKTCPHFMRGRLWECFPDGVDGEAPCENGVR